MLHRIHRMRFYYAFLFVYLIFQLLFLSFLKSTNLDTHSNALKVLELYKKLVVRLNENSESDNSGMYKIFHTKNLKKGEPYFDVTLASQCSSNHLYAIENFFSVWKGPISVAVFTEVENVERTLWDVAKLIHCNVWVDLRLHIVVPNQNIYIRDFNYGYNVVTDFDKSISCSSSQVQNKNTRINYNWTTPYPVNLLRNVAKSGSPTEFILVIDIDMTPSRNLRSDFLDFMKPQIKSLGKEVYVVPVFETPIDVPIPQTKKELVKKIKLNQARPFYFVPCRNCQKFTRYNEWLSFDETMGTRILYQVEWKHPWEPFFIARYDAPNFDERFKQYGMNRVSQICELHVAGYKFLVLDNAFLVHRGYKTMVNFHDKKDYEMEENRRLYSRFKSELKYKYPNSEKSC